MKKLALYIRAPFGKKGVEEVIRESDHIRRALAVDNTEVHFESTVVTKGIIEIDEDRVNITGRPWHSITITAPTANGIVYGIMGLIGAVDKLNSRINENNSWLVGWDMDDFEKETFNFEDFFRKPTAEKYWALPEFDVINYDELIERLR